MPRSPRRRIGLVTVIGGLNGLVRPGSADHDLRRLDTSNGCQDHTVLPSAGRASPRGLADRARPPKRLRSRLQRRSSCAPSIAHRQSLPCDPASAPDAAASTASRPNVRDDGQRPSSRAGIAEVVMLIWGKREAIYFRAGDWTDSITLNGREKFAFARIGKWREEEPFHAIVPAVTRKPLA